MMKILHIDDEESITEVIGTFLEIEGYEYESANNGREGLELIKVNHYDVVLLDLNMPEFSGFDVIDSLVSDDIINNQKIVLFSAIILTPEQMGNLNKAGVNAIIRKPILNDSLLARLQKIEQENNLSPNLG